MVTPQDLGLPTEIKSWRPGQYEAIEDIAEVLLKYLLGPTPESRLKASVFATLRHSFYLLDAPTGVGKSIIGIAATRRILQGLNASKITIDQSEPVRCIYLCKTKQLQDQILSEFPEARTVKGRTNYPCSLAHNKFPKVTAEDCIEGCPLRKPENQVNCPYLHAKNQALAAPIAVLNQSYFLAEANGPGQFGSNSMLIVDEVDTLENELLSHIQLTVTQKLLDQLKHYPENYDELTSWREWVVSAPIDRLVERSEKQMPLLFDPRSGTFLGDMTDSQIEIYKGIVRLRALQRKLNRFAMEVSDNWVFYEEKNDKGEISWIFKPVFISDYAFGYCWKHTKCVLGMSGTILDHKLMSDSLGIPLEEVKYHRIPSLFPPEKRLVYYQGVANLTRDTLNSELPKIAEAVDGLLLKHAWDKVLVHTTSYQIRDYLIANLTPSWRFITHGRENRAEKLEEFKKSTIPLVMLSPSFDRGVSLEYDQCRAIIVCKIPYPNLADLQIKKRMEAPNGNLWYLTQAVRTIIQMTGRGMRHENDYVTSYILDTQFRRLFGRVRHLFPDWWQKALRW